MRDGLGEGQSRGWRFKAIAILLLIGVSSAVAELIITQRSNVAAERASLAEDAARGLRVEVTTATAGPAFREIRLFADVRPYAEVTLFGKVSGYIKTLPVDKGDMVKKDQLIAEIASPETDAQYASATADLANKKILAERNDRLFQIGAVSRETAEQADTNYSVAQAMVAQLETLRSYERLIAPLDGRVTARYADPGALVQNATNSQTSALPVVTISDTSHLRVDAYVQQQDAPFVHAGDVVEIEDATNPARKISARVSRTSGELDTKSRTLLVEIDVENQRGFFVGGSFAYVTLHLKVPPAPQVPLNALVLRDNQQFIAVPDDSNIVHFRPVLVESTDGTVVRIVDGIRAGEKVAVNVPDEISDGSRIQPIAMLKN
jgi:membrane fusion protein (multidrug efflux system)